MRILSGDCRFSEVRPLLYLSVSKSICFDINIAAGICLILR